MKIALKIVAALLIAALAFCCIKGIGPFVTGSSQADTAYAEMADAPESSGLLRGELTDAQRPLYDRLAAAVEACSPSLHLPTSSYTKEDLSAAVSALYYDHPELFWFDYGGTAMIIDSTGVTVSFTYFAAGDELDAMKQSFTAALNSFTAAAAGLSDDWSRALAVHDAIVAACSYDATVSLDNIHSAYGALCGGSAVCDGYAKAFQCAMDKLGIPCRTVPGEATLVEGVSAESHAWNLVCLDGTWTYVDVTWDDLDFESYSRAPASSSAASHAYFGLSDLQIFENHTPAASDLAVRALPEAADLNWYDRIGRSSADGADLEAALAGDLAANLGGDSVGWFELRLTDPEGADAFFDGGYLNVLDQANDNLSAAGDERSFPTEVRYYILSEQRGCYLFTCEAS